MLTDESRPVAAYVTVPAPRRHSSGDRASELLRDRRRPGRCGRRARRARGRCRRCGQRSPAAAARACRFRRWVVHLRSRAGVPMGRRADHAADPGVRGRKTFPVEFARLACSPARAARRYASDYGARSCTSGAEPRASRSVRTRRRRGRVLGWHSEARSTRIDRGTAATVWDDRVGDVPLRLPSSWPILGDLSMKRPDAFVTFIVRASRDRIAVVVRRIVTDAVVDSFVTAIVTRSWVVIDKPEFTNTLEIGDGVIKYGSFLTVLINLLMHRARARSSTRADGLRRSIALARRSSGEEDGSSQDSDLARIRDLLSAQRRRTYTESRPETAMLAGSVATSRISGRRLLWRRRRPCRRRGRAPGRSGCAPS